MEIKRLISHFTYRIEPKPGGGFIAHATDPAVPPLEAATREELQEKIQANIAAALVREFPGLKLPLETKEVNFLFHIERKPGGGLAIRSADPSAPAIEGNTHEDIESHFAEKLIGMLGKHFAPALAQALAAGAASGGVKVSVGRGTGVTVKFGSPALPVGKAGDPAPAAFFQPDATADMKPGVEIAPGANLSQAGDAIANRPIVPETSGSWRVLCLLLALLIAGALTYLLLLHH